MDLITQQYQYGQEYYNYVNQNYQMELPTQEELEVPKKYQNRIPDYQLSSGGRHFQQGVIVNTPWIF